MFPEHAPHFIHHIFYEPDAVRAERIAATANVSEKKCQIFLLNIKNGQKYKFGGVIGAAASYSRSGASRRKREEEKKRACHRRRGKEKTTT